MLHNVNHFPDVYYEERILKKKKTKNKKQASKPLYTGLVKIRLELWIPYKE